MLETFKDYIYRNLCAGAPEWVADCCTALAVGLLAVITYYIAKRLLLIVEKIVARSETEWDDDIINARMLAALSQLAPALTVRYLLPRLFEGAHHWLAVLTSLYIVVAVVRIFTIFLTNLYYGLARRDSTSPYAVNGIFQMLKLIAIGLGIIVGLSLVINREPGAILAALGASAAVLMLVFRDTILGLVASIQLTANKMLHRGDWIEVPKHGANGEVIEVSLTTVKVRNWDNSVSTIPPYSLVSESFRNYQAMRNSGGRRVERALLIDITSIDTMSADTIATLRADGTLDGVEASEGDVNITVLRRWITHRLATDPRVNTDMLLMVRQLAPTPTGLPLELYFFTRTTAWVEYENIQSDIFDRIHAAVGAFGLRLYQQPSGSDLSGLRR